MTERKIQMLDIETKKKIEAINSRPITDFIHLDKAKHATKAHFYVCPICKSGSKKDSGLSIYPNNRIVCNARNCFGSKGEDTVGALRIIWGCDTMEVIKNTGYNRESEAKIEEGYKKYKALKAAAKEDEPAKASYLSFYRQCHEELLASPEALEYLHGRGITDESIKRFNLGYCAAWKHSKAGARVKGTRRIIIPRSEYTYTARLMDPASNEAEAAYKKQIEGTAKDLFNLEALPGASIVWVCEGELDAISQYQAGASCVVAIGSISNIDVMAEKAKENKEAIYILALDNDPNKEDGSNPGKAAQQKLYENLEKEGITSLNFDPATIYGKAKDANEALIKNPSRLKKAISKAEAMANEKIKEKGSEDNNTLGETVVKLFIERVTDPSRPYEPIRTGITDIDRALEGGFMRGTLVTLGAPPAMGKTALAQYIFENMARNGHDILYINLEMTREQLLARSISRLAFLYEEKDITALEVLRGYAWTEEQRKAITNAIEIYQQEIAPHFVYNPDNVTNDIDSILQEAKKHIDILREKQRPAPIICIDYLQLIDSKETDPLKGMKNIIFNLKSFAKRENTVIFLIIANNRASNKSGSVDMESGRDTSAIEYSGDVMLGLVYTAIEEGRKYQAGEKKDGSPLMVEYDLEAIRRIKKEAYEDGRETPQICKEITLKVIKNRFADSERTANLIFDGKHATYSQIEWKKCNYNVFKRI